MSAAIHDTFTDHMPAKIEIENANHLYKIMATILNKDKPTKLQLIPEEGQIFNVTLSPTIANTFLQTLQLILSRAEFQPMLAGVELTTQQAANHLNVSRSFLIELLEAGEIPFTTTRRHRKIRAEELFAYKARRDSQRAEALSDMAKLDAEKDYL